MRLAPEGSFPAAGAVAVAFVSIFLLSGGAAAAAPLAHPGAASTTVSEIDMANDRCSVVSSPTTCEGGYGTNVTFRATLAKGELVTVTFAYLYGNSQNVTLSFSDSLGNSPVLVASQCSASSPIVCSAVGYFQVTKGGVDDIYFTENGGSIGEIWYNAEIWQGQFGRRLGAVGTSAFCASGCTSQTAIGPLNLTASETVGEVVGVSAYAAFYPYTPANWVPGYAYSYSCTDSMSTGGDSILWQGTTSVLGSYSFGASTTPAPLSWAGSAELIFAM